MIQPAGFHHPLPPSGCFAVISALSAFSLVSAVDLLLPSPQVVVGRQRILRILAHRHC